MAVAALVLATATSGAAAHPDDEDPAYHWVRPPSGHRAPDGGAAGRTAVVPADPAFRSFWTPDLQLVLDWEPGALRSTTTIDVAPIDPAELPPLPDGAAAVGNAYRVTLRPRGVLAAPARVRLRVPSPATSMYRTDDGVRWREAPILRSEPDHVSASFDGDGTVVAAAVREEAPADARSARRGVALAVVTITALLLAAWRRRRSASRRP